MSNEHILTHYNEALAKLSNIVIALGRDIISGLQDVKGILDSVDATYSDKLGLKCVELMEKQKSILVECESLITVFQPIARDLRYVIALTRSADKLGGSIEQLLVLQQRIKGVVKNGQHCSRLVELVQMAEKEMEDAIFSLEHQDKDRAATVKVNDKKLNREHRELLEHIVSVKDNHDSLPIDVDSIFFIRAVERIGDYAKGIAKSVMFL